MKRDVFAEALEVHRQVLFVDGHADTPQRFVDEDWGFADECLGLGHLSLETARLGGLDAEFFAIWAEPSQWEGRYAHRTLQLIDGVLEQVRKNPETMVLGKSVRDLLAARASGKFCALMGIEGGHSIEADLGLLRTYFALGVRYMTLTWSNSNEWADSSGDLADPEIKHHGGLTAFGRLVVLEMNRLGMMVDVSHTSDATFEDVIETSVAPVIASHSSARAITEAPRNLTDAMMRAVAERGGIVMVNFFPAFIDESWRAAWNAQKTERMKEHLLVEETYRARGEPVPFWEMLQVDHSFAKKFPRAPMSALVDHFDHAIKVAGIEHVGVGTDFDGFATLPDGLNSAADLPKITAALMQRGYSAEELEKVLGKNLVRVFGAVEAVAEGMA